MSKFTIVVPRYDQRFHCIGSACEDTSCCQAWVVGIDPAAAERYKALPPSALRTQLDECILPAESNQSQNPPGGFASIRMLPSGECPFLSGDRLCRIQKELGKRYLGKICQEYPRQFHKVDRIEESSLSLSCPEAGRLVLLDPALLDPALLDPALRSSSTVRHKVRWDNSVSCAHPLRTFFWPIREFVLQLVLNRSYALWQRMFLLGVFCQRLDAIARHEDKRTFPEFVRDFSAVVATGSLRGPMDTIPGNPGLQLKLVTELVRLGTSNAGRTRPRLQQCLSAFDSTIRPNADASFEDQIASYTAAFGRDYEPFFRDRPWILENYLVNELIGWAFPFGETFFEPEGEFDFTASFAQLAIRFGILKGLLIGVAGFHGPAFSGSHVVQTVQLVSRQFEHSPRFLSESYAFLVEQKLADLSGLTALLRN